MLHQNSQEHEQASNIHLNSLASCATATVVVRCLYVLRSMNLMRSSLYCFFQGGIMVQHTSLMSLKTIGCTSLFSLIHTASKIWRICLTALTALSNTLNGKIQNYPMTFMSMRSMQTTSVIKKRSKPGSPYTSLFGSNINKTNCFLLFFVSLFSSQ